jgi:hypothetical protein
VKTALYYVGVSFLFTHELDAVTHSEWRLLFGLRSLSDATASPIFVLLHVPLFFAILWFSHVIREPLRDYFRLGLSIFFVVHTVLHFSLSSAPHYDFNGAMSRSLIVGAGLCGLAYVVAWWQTRRRGPRDQGKAA